MVNSGDYAKQRGLLISQSGNECENWIDPVLNIVYKMNMLVHVGEDIAKLFDRIATKEEIADYMDSLGFSSTDKDGEFENDAFIISDIKPKNVMYSSTGDIIVIDAEITKK